VCDVADAALRRHGEACNRCSRPTSETSAAGISAECSRHSDPQLEQTCSAVHEISAAGDTAAAETTRAAQQGL